ncbi:MAG: EF-hand domain-containing protein [Candidatus Hydrogenedentes bacterium]|nr:EF-hand domain-containing protein [Candidatus Hydrogenedentota bacterium]
MNISSISSSLYSMQSMQKMGGMNAMRGTPPSSSDMAAHILEEEDSDGDGMISLSETKLSEDMFNEIDSDGDGLLTTDEIEASFESQRAEHAARMATQLIEDEDTDGDGMISVSETKAPEDVFNKIDTDGDGLLTTEELEANLESMGPPPPPPGEGGAQGAPASSQSIGYDSLTSLLDILNQNEASEAYGSSQNWLSSLLSSVSSNPALTA